MLDEIEYLLTNNQLFDRIKSYIVAWSIYETTMSTDVKRCTTVLTLAYAASIIAILGLISGFLGFLLNKDNRSVVIAAISLIAGIPFIIYSQTHVYVYDVTGYTLKSGVEKIRDGKLNVIYDSNHSDCIIDSTEPAAGSIAKVGSDIIVHYSITADNHKKEDVMSINSTPTSTLTVTQKPTQTATVTSISTKQTDIPTSKPTATIISTPVYIEDLNPTMFNATTKSWQRTEETITGDSYSHGLKLAVSGDYTPEGGYGGFTGELRYDLQGKYTKFTCTVVLPTVTAKNESIQRILIYFDEQEKQVQTIDINNDFTKQTFELDVTGVNTFSIVIREAYGSMPVLKFQSDYIGLVNCWFE